MGNPRFRQRYLLLFPPFFWLGLFFLVPLLIVTAFSVLTPDQEGGLVFELTWRHYREALSPLYLDIYLRSFAYAGATTVITLVLGYPTAYYMAFARPIIQKTAMFLVVLPLWTNLLVELYALIILLGNTGLINQVLTRTGIIPGPLPLLDNTFSVLTGLIYWNLPYMVLPIFTSLERMNLSLCEASADLGANRFQIFKDVVLPVSLPGVIAGAVFCFIPTLGNFFVPDVLGGPDTYLIGNLITSQFLGARNWHLGSALSSVLILVILVCVVAYIRYAGPKTGRQGV